MVSSEHLGRYFYILSKARIFLLFFNKIHSSLLQRAGSLRCTYWEYDCTKTEGNSGELLDDVPLYHAQTKNTCRMHAETYAPVNKAV